MNPGDLARLHSGAVHVFTVVEVDTDHATIAPAGDAATATGAYPFRVPLSVLTPAS
ncbi:hypothetical protein [Rhodococcoides corynebacterioides]|uniref:Uncharacterized protein n=1 Tax=Rhodococcoides corynebacterioides TaxID=53972 RepID=A0ABS7P3J2_9NOCA|nr:hypothetical protein [Rhodococcus corynebacterioides]MBY6366953.1 hypothetical protein [Rhodococcus corynebacterioides]MBY6407755.1 hypothetical protein [Rhodococcus corynebacterioides]